MVVVASHLNEPKQHAPVLELLEKSDQVTVVPAEIDDPLTLPPGTEVLFTRPAPAWRALKGTPRPASWPPTGLRWIQSISAGVDPYPDWLLDSTPFVNGRGATAPSISEFALTAMLAHAKQWDRLPVRQASDWRPRNLGSLAYSTVGIAGLGAIGLATARLSTAVGARVLAWRRSPGSVEGVERVGSIDDLLRESDHLVLALPLTEETRDIINARSLALAKPRLHIVNVGRGGLIDEAALIAALDSGVLSGATLDTVKREPPPEGHPFYTHPKVRMSAHTSWSGPGAPGRLVDRFLENLARDQQGLPLLDVVDVKLGY